VQDEHQWLEEWNCRWYHLQGIGVTQPSAYIEKQESKSGRTQKSKEETGKYNTGGEIN
jgi:hypothetical protein